MRFFKSRERKESIPIHQVRPWARFFARNLDQVIFLFPLSLLVSLLFSDSFAAHYLLIGALFFMPLFSLYEAYCLSRWGYTPGKWLMGVKVRDLEGRYLSFRRAFWRSMNVWILGYAWMIPFITYVANAWGYHQLTRYGSTAWDRGYFHISHKRISLWKGIFSTLIAALFLLFVLLAFPQPKVETIILTSNDGEWKITLVEGWQAKSGQEAMHAYHEGDGATLGVSLVRSLKQNNVRLQERLLDLMLDQFTEFRVLGPFEGTVNQRPAVQIEIVGVAEQGDLGVLETLIEVPSGVMVVCFYAPKEKFHTLLPSFRLMTESFDATELVEQQNPFY